MGGAAGRPEVTCISDEGVRLMVILTNEELVIARDTRELVQ